MTPPQRFSFGQRLTTRDLNQFSAEQNRQAKFAVAPPLTLTNGPNGYTVGLQPQSMWAKVVSTSTSTGVHNVSEISFAANGVYTTAGRTGRAYLPKTTSATSPFPVLDDDTIVYCVKGVADDWVIIEGAGVDTVSGLPIADYGGGTAGTEQGWPSPDGSGVLGVQSRVYLPQTPGAFTVVLLTVSVIVTWPGSGEFMCYLSDTDSDLTSLLCHRDGAGKAVGTATMMLVRNTRDYADASFHTSIYWNSEPGSATPSHGLQWRYTTLTVDPVNFG